jgi:hypothetical protein
MLRFLVQQHRYLRRAGFGRKAIPRAVRIYVFGF